MKAWVFLLLLGWPMIGCAQWRPALPGWEYRFPRDHAAHPDFKTEWWYATGNLAATDGRAFGYELTFFRQGLRPPASQQPGESAWIANQLVLAHFAITDVAGKRFRYDHRLNRAALGLAGFGEEERVAWVEGWSVRLRPDGTWRLRAENAEMALDLTLRSPSPPVVHGRDGVSQKSAGSGHASHYYSLTDLATSGSLRHGNERVEVAGRSWFDHEWATNQLSAAQLGWDWLGLHLDDGSQLMLYQLRLKDGGIDPASSGTLIRPDGSVIRLRRADFILTPGRRWKSPATGVAYPLQWEIEIPAHGLSLRVRPALEDQEMRVPPAAYWEGSVQIEGRKDSRPLTGRGYLELTGYGGAIRGLAE